LYLLEKSSERAMIPTIKRTFRVESYQTEKNDRATL